MYTVKYRHLGGWTLVYYNVQARSRDDAIDKCDYKVIRRQLGAGYLLVN